MQLLPLIQQKPLLLHDEAGFAFVHFKPFEPLPKEKWVRHLSDMQLVGEKWLMGSYRYVNAEHEYYLEQLMEGMVPKKPPFTSSTIVTGIRWLSFFSQQMTSHFRISRWML